MNRVIRPMKSEDLQTIYEIEKSVFSDPWPIISFSEEINNDSVSFPFIFENNKNIIGYAICWYYLFELHIGNFAIRHEDQGKGHGRYFLEELFHCFSEFKTAYLEVRETNEKAIRLYRNFGFDIAYKRKKYYKNGEDALVMVKMRP